MTVENVGELDSPLNVAMHQLLQWQFESLVEAGVPVGHFLKLVREIEISLEPKIEDVQGKFLFKKIIEMRKALAIMDMKERRKR